MSRSVIGQLVAAGDGVLIQPVQSLTAASSFTLNITPGMWRRVIFFVRGTGGFTNGFATSVRIAPNNDLVGPYSWNYRISNGGASMSSASDSTFGSNAYGLVAITASSPAGDIDLRIEQEVSVVGAGIPRGFRSSWFSRGTTTANDTAGNSNGCWRDATTPISSLVILFGSAFSGVVEARGTF